MTKKSWYLLLIAAFFIFLSFFISHKAEAATTYTQSNFRFYMDNDAIQPTDAWPSGATDLNENAAMATTTSPIDDGELVRIRMSVTIGTDNLNASTQAFKLQYGSLNATTTSSLCSSIGSWTDVGAAGSASIWRGESDGNPADGTTLSSGLLTGSNIMASYEEQNNSVNNPNAINVGEIGEWDWLIENNGAVHDNIYCFRMVLSDGTAFGTYTNYPQINTEWTTFNSSFEGGNGEVFYKPYGGNSAAVRFNSELEIGGPLASACTTNYRKQNWFYFSMNNALNQSITLTLINAFANSNENSNWTDHKPVYSYDGITWYRISSTGSISSPNITYTLPGGGAVFTSDTVYIAHNIPYVYTDMENDIATWSTSPYVTVADIGYATEGTRMMHLMTIKDASSPIAEADKQVYWMIARQHPMEPMTNWRLKGVIDFIIGNSEEAKLMRRSSIFKIVPMMNPDGVYAGNTTANTVWCNLNREWVSTGPSLVTEAVEVYNVDTAIYDWMRNGTPADVNAFMDFHTQCADPQILHAGGNGGTPGYTWYDTQNHENIFEILLKIFDGNDHEDEFAGSTQYGFTFNMFSEYHTATWGNDLESFNLEGTTYDFSDHTYPTKINSAAFGVAYLKMVFANQENDSKIFVLNQTDPLGTSVPPNYSVVVAPNKFIAILNNDKGGGIEYWYDLENDSLMLNNLVDTDSVLDPIDWNDGTQDRSLINTTNATLTVESYGGDRVKLKYTGQLEGVSGEDYTLERVIYADGRVNTQFVFTNNTGSPIDFGTMKQSVNVDYADRASFNEGYDNTDLTPTSGTDNWFGWFGNGTGSIKASYIAYFQNQTGGWVYDTYASTSDATYGLSNWYSMADGPTIANGGSVTTTITYLVKPDNDLLANEGHADAWRNDFANPNSPTMSYGTFTEFNGLETGLQFAASSSAANFTYTNADTVTKKQPIYVLTNYTANTAPVLKVGGAFLDSETGTAHSATLHTSASYGSSVDTTNDIAYVQYYSDISTNDNVMIGASIPSDAPTAPSSATATYSSDVQIGLAWSDGASDEDGFKIERRGDTGSGWGSFTQIGTAAGNATSFTDNSTNNPSSPPVANSLYQYRVRAYNVAGNSAYATDSSCVTTTPASPTIGTPTADSSTAITWAWTDNAGFEDSYRLDFVTGSGTDADGIAANSTSHQSTGLSPNTQYAVQIHAYQNDRGESSASATSTATYTLANAPGGLSLSLNSNGQISASWSANSNPSGTEYYIENSTKGTNSGWTTGLTWTSGDLNCGATYNFQVKARNGDGTPTGYTTASQASNNCVTSNGSQVGFTPNTNPVYGVISPSFTGPISKQLNNGGTIEAIISANTFSNTATITITPQDIYTISNNNPIPTGRNIFGIYVTNIQATVNGNQINELTVPATINFKYTDADVTTNGIDENKLRIYYYHEPTDQWIPLYTSTVNPLTNTVSALTYHFSLYSLFVEEENAAPITPLIKIYNDPKIYAITTNNYKHHIPNEKSFYSYNYQWDKVMDISTVELNSYPEVNLIKLEGDPKVYLLSNNTKSWITNEKVFNDLGLSWSAIIQVTPDELSYYPAGSNLTSANQPPSSQPTITNNGQFVFTKFLNIGSSGEEVKQLQTILKDLGYFNYPTITGLYGSVTKQAVKDFQKAHGIVQAGYVGPATRDALNED